jgi:hypothetical protein
MRMTHHSSNVIFDLSKENYTIVQEIFIDLKEIFVDPESDLLYFKRDYDGSLCF